MVTGGTVREMLAIVRMLCHRREMRPNLRDVMALLDSVKEGETFSVTIEQKQWSCWSGGPYTMGRDRRRSVRKALDEAEKIFVAKRLDTQLSRESNDDQEES